MTEDGQESWRGAEGVGWGSRYMDGREQRKTDR